MGKRKERRVAAMMAAGRRVKLDLFADPSSGEASIQEEVGRDSNHEHEIGVSTSPSSTGKKEENPLLLLGQYSDDDEVDEEAIDEPKKSPAAPDAQVEQSKDTNGNVENDNNEGSVPGDFEQEVIQTDAVKNMNDHFAEENSVARITTQQSECDPSNETYPESSGMQIVGDVDGTWKIVMHEQSKQCYYWNTITGETSWEMPNGLSSEEVTAIGVALPVGGQMTYSIEAQAPGLPQNTMSAYSSGLAAGNSSMEAYGTLIGYENGQVAQDAYAYTVQTDLGPAQQSDALLSQQLMTSSDDSMDVDPVQLLKYGDELLQRLELLERQHASPVYLEWIKREIEIRMSDCKALSSYGSSLLPFWFHTEIQLKQLQSSISKAEGAESKDSCQDHFLHNTGMDSEMAEKYRENGQAELTTNPPGKDSKIEACDGKDAVGNVKSEEHSMLFAPKLEGEDGGNYLVSKVESAAEDVDMDVEMEVDEEISGGNELPSFVPNCEPPPEEMVQSSNLLPPGCPPAPPNDIDIPPPPPDDEWVPPPPPPPPPESEPDPPPPPEEPIVAHAHVDTIPPSYQSQFNLGYTYPTIYYAPACTNVADSNYYAQVDGSQILDTQPSSYLLPVSVTSAESAVGDITVDPSTYYNVPVMVPPAQMVSTTEATESYVLSATGTLTEALAAKSAGATSVSESSSLANAKLGPNNPTSIAKPEENLSREANVASTSQAIGSTLVIGSSAHSLTTSKNQAKAVVRSKKRTVAVSSSLRSNKKVSSLVDKWKAAKEELDAEEEEEPRNAYELLERKRQKEIDQWRAQQIASGEAQDNANFIPLGGDWRERIKRRRNEVKVESVQAPAAAERDKGEPDLVELSKDLPSGWQAFWDESSKQVYYGNNMTSETTWTRPTQ